MGAWGVGVFDNDDACDWVYDLEKSDGLDVIESTLDKLINDEEYIEAPEGCNALAAAEVIAALSSRPSAGLTEEVRAWLEGKPAPGAELIAKARKATDAVESERSELFQLWKDAAPEDFAAWKQLNSDLKNRLA